MPHRMYRDRFILQDVTHADAQAQVRRRGGSADHDGSASSLPPRRASANSTFARDMYATHGATNRSR